MKTSTRSVLLENVLYCSLSSQRKAPNRRLRIDDSLFFVLCALTCAWLLKGVSGGKKENILAGEKNISRGKTEYRSVPTYV
jgi:hypothetical protein